MTRAVPLQVEEIKTQPSLERVNVKDSLDFEIEDTSSSSETRLFSFLSPEKRILVESLLFRIRSVKKAKNNKYVLLNAPNDKLDIICKLLPGMKSPTILPLAEQGWSSVHSVIQESDFWDVIENLKANGAQGILIIPIEKMVV